MTSWYDDYGAATYATGTTIDGINISYDKKFLEVAKNELYLVGYGQQRPLPEGEGKTIQFYRWLNIAASTSAALLTEGVNPNATILSGQDLQAVIKEYGAFAQLTSLVKASHIDRNVMSASALFGEHGATIIDLLTHYQVCANGAYPIAADLATTSKFAGVVDAGGAATTLIDSALNANTNYGDANDDLNQSVIIITSGAGYGQARVVTDFVTATGTCTVSPAWDVIPAAGDTYVVVTPDEMADGDTLSYANLKAARTTLAKYKARRFAGGYYVLIVDPDMLSGLMADADWKITQGYRTDQEGLFKGEVKEFAGFRVIEETNAFKFPITTRGTAGTSYGPGADGANFSATAAISSAIALGQEAFGVTTFRNQKGQLPRPTIKVKTPGPNDTSNPLDRYGTVGWVLPFVTKALNPLHAVQIFNYTG
jgi:hypothetical protein